MEKKKITSGYRPNEAKDKSYEMNGSHNYQGADQKFIFQKPELSTDYYDREEQANADYDRNEQP